MTLAKLQNPVKSAFDSVNDSLKETHSGLNKYTKSLDKVCESEPAYWRTIGAYILLVLQGPAPTQHRT